jgi:hypothetical protein
VTREFKGWGEDGGSVGEEDRAARASCHCVHFGKQLRMESLAVADLVDQAVAPSSFSGRFC